MPERHLTPPMPVTGRGPRALRGRTRGSLALAWTLVLVVALLGLTGCGGQPHPYLSELEKLPGATLLYPGSHLDAALGSDSNRQMGVNAAIYGNRALTHDSAAQVLTYYDTQLRALGWTRDDSGALWDEYWETGYAWTLGARVLKLGFYGKHGIDQMVQMHHEYAGYTTIYETHLQ